MILSILSCLRQPNLTHMHVYYLTRVSTEFDIRANISRIVYFLDTMYIGIIIQVRCLASARKLSNNYTSNIYLDTGQLAPL